MARPIPGETITYDVNISNSGGADATGVNFLDTIDANTRSWEDL
jgi:uncharacterized repeat protein (TIGR01451 family)